MYRPGPAAAAALCAAAFIALGLAGGGAATPGGLTTHDFVDGANPSAMAAALVGGGSDVTVSNVTFRGNQRAAGTFSNGASSIGFDSGIVLGTGHIETRPGDNSDDSIAPCTKGLEGPNQCHELFNDFSPTSKGADSFAYNGQGDPQLSSLVFNNQTNDAAELEFDFVPKYPTIEFQYVFGSEEYSDYANTQFNDVFGFFVNGQNCALVPGTALPVSVNSINNGSDLQGGDRTPHHPELFRANVPTTPSGSAPLDTELDGLTTVLTCHATVQAGVTNHLKLAIADTQDALFDSAVFLKAGSLVSESSIATQLSGGGSTGPSITVDAGTPVTDQATLTGAEASAATGTVTYTVYSDSTCKTVAADGGTKTITGGVVPASDPVKLATPGTYYWIADYSGDSGNNAATSACGDEVETVTAPPRSLSVADATATEGGNLAFTVSLDQPATVPVTVDYATADGSATAPSDYTAASGTLTFAAGDTTKQVVVHTVADGVDENDETMSLNLSSPSNATVGDGSATGTIVDGDTPPLVSIADTTVTEGDSGTTPATFTVSLSAASGKTVTVDYSTQDGTADAGSDYKAAAGTLTFDPGVTSKTVSVDVIGDTAYEGDETFGVRLSNPANTTIARSVGTATIADDDQENRPPTCASATASPSLLWPANGKFVTVTVGGCSSPSGRQLTYTVTSVTQNEPLGGSPDATRVPGHPNQVQLRAERAGTGVGRTYTITFTVSDGQGTPAAGSVQVLVPHDKNTPAPLVVDSFGG